MKRLTKEGWRALGVYNSYILCQRGKVGVYVGYNGAESGLTARYAFWIVIRPGYRTDPNGHWKDNYNKTFSVPRREYKDPRRLEAIEYAASRYKISGEWERDPWGNWHPAGTMEAARANLTVAAV